jgi:hypothetical protein
MRSRTQRVVLIGCLSAAVLVPTFGNAQVIQAPTPPPPATPQYAEWQFNGEPMAFNGLVYYSTRGTRFFDSQIMTQVGVYRGVPVYADVTLQQSSVVYVPVGRGLMRAYEVNAVRDIGALQQTPPFEAPPLGTAGAVVPAAAASASTSDIPRPTRMESVLRPNAQNGVWLEYRGARYYSDGPATAFDAKRFTRVGEYRGFPVYRSANGSSDQIWVTVIENGPVAPYVKR